MIFAYWVIFIKLNIYIKILHIVDLLFKKAALLIAKRINQFWIANAGLLEVQGLPRSCSVDNTYQQQNNTHTNPI